MLRNVEIHSSRNTGLESRATTLGQTQLSPAGAFRLFPSQNRKSRELRGCDLRQFHLFINFTEHISRDEGKVLRAMVVQDIRQRSSITSVFTSLTSEINT